MPEIQQHNDKKIFDVHFHAFNLSHPNFSAFVDRLNLRPTFKFTISRIFFYLMGKLKIFTASLKSTRNLKQTLLHLRTGKGSDDTNLSIKAMNLISIMDNDIEDYFLYLEYFLENSKEFMSQMEYSGKNKIILTPLIMDFGLSEKKFDTAFENQIFYKFPPQKSVIKQVKDLFYGIKRYYDFSIQVSEKIIDGTTMFDIKHKISDKNISEKIESKLFEIYPFMGLNPLNNSFTQLQNLLEKYFGEYDLNKYSGDVLYNKFYNKLGIFDGNVYEKGFNYNFLFAGIKMYPPLGFDPYPENNSEEMAKNKYLFDFCEKRGIPITVHCSDGGFVTIKDNILFTSPHRWENVLYKFPKLKLNLAHFGHQTDTFHPDSWRNKIISMIEKYDNLYTDLGDLGSNNAFYNELIMRVNKNKILADRVLFGSDFMINLLGNNSYNDYLFKFFNSDIDQELKNKFCNTNPAKFLFG